MENDKRGTPEFWVEKAKNLKVTENMTLEQFRIRVGAPTFLDDHGIFTPSRGESKAYHRRMNETLARRFAQGEASYEAWLIVTGRKEQVEAEERAEAVRLQVESIESWKRTIKNLGSMSHRKNGKLRKKYQEKWDEMDVELESLGVSVDPYP